MSSSFPPPSALGSARLDGSRYGALLLSSDFVQLPLQIPGDASQRNAGGADRLGLSQLVLSKLGQCGAGPREVRRRAGVGERKEAGAVVNRAGNDQQGAIEGIAQAAVDTARRRTENLTVGG